MALVATPRTRCSPEHRPIPRPRRPRRRGQDDPGGRPGRLAPRAGPRGRHLPRPRRHGAGRPAPRDPARPRRRSNLSLRAEMLLFMASRAQLVEEVIRPGARRPGRSSSPTASCWPTSSIRGTPAGLPVEEVGQVGRAATGGLLPDLTLVLDVPPERGPRPGRRGAGPDRGPARRLPRAGPRGVPPRGREAGGPLPVLPRADRRGRRLGRPRRGRRADPKRGGACPGTRSAAMTGSSTTSGGPWRRGGSRTPSCSSAPRGSASGRSRGRWRRPCSASARPRPTLDPCERLPGLPPGRGRHAPRPPRGRPARGQARAADQGDPRPLPRPRPQADARHAQGRDRRRRRRPERRGGQRLPQDAGGAARRARS